MAPRRKFLIATSMCKKSFCMENLVNRNRGKLCFKNSRVWQSFGTIPRGVQRRGSKRVALANPNINTNTFALIRMCRAHETQDVTHIKHTHRHTDTHVRPYLWCTVSETTTSSAGRVR